MEEQTLTQTIYVCAECGTKCSTKTNINVHMKRKHKDFVKPLPLKTIKCPLCNTLLSSMTELDHHFANVHDLSLKEENLQFNSLEEFKEWKLKTETNSQSSFVVLNSRILADKSKIIKYICHRSGKYTENIKNTKRKRQPKVKGSNKIGYNCPARIITKISCKGDIKVKYISTHVGHKLKTTTLSPMTATICHPHNKNLELQNRRQSSSVVQLPLKSLKRNRKREVEKEVFDNDITLLNLVFDNEKTCDNNL